VVHNVRSATYMQQLLIHSGYFHSTSSSPLLLIAAPDYSIDSVSELTYRSATGNNKADQIKQGILRSFISTYHLKINYNNPGVQGDLVPSPSLDRQHGTSLPTMWRKQHLWRHSNHSPWFIFL